MKIRVENLDLKEVKCDLLVVNEFEGVKTPGGATGAADKALGGIITELTHDGEIDGKLGKVTIIHFGGKLKARKVAVVGLGKKDKFDLEAVRTASAAAIKTAREVKAKTVATIIHGCGCGELDVEQSAKAVVEGSVLGVYKFTGYAKEKDSPELKIEQLILIDNDPTKVKNASRGAKLGLIIAEAENYVRDLVNEPSNKMTPTAFGSLSKKIAKINGLKYACLDPREEGMEALWSVAKGSDEPP
ncbi:MAG: M17 family peptidase N-terminal domain-containing protein, partial [bacterium]